MIRGNGTPDRPTLRCAIYTRVSTDERLGQDFNSLDAQRESGEAYIKSQAHEGWECLADQYDDGGYTGANVDRPALKRLLADIEAGRIDVVVVYKVDRLSRSLLDFGRLMEVFDRHNVSFVSVTQAFNTSTSMGRLILNVLLSFAQFEREMISERTRDKIAAARRKGKWSGGQPLLGYTVVATKLVVDAIEAERVRQIFALYLEFGSLLATVAELNRRGWRTKTWTTKKDVVRGGRPFNKTTLYQLLTNVTYVGQVRYKLEVHAGEHQPIVDDDLFRQVQAALTQNGRGGGSNARNKHGALLRGILRCAACDCAMGHTYATKGNRRYRYYVCIHAQKHGRKTCPAPSVPADQVERFAVEQIQAIGRDPGVVAATLAATRQGSQEATVRLKREKLALERQCRNDEAQLGQLASAPGLNGQRASLLVEAQDRIGTAHRRLTEISEALAALIGDVITEREVVATLADFEGLWGALVPREQARVLQLLIERIDYDGVNGSMAITLSPTGIKTLADELEEVSA